MFRLVVRYKQQVWRYALEQGQDMFLGSDDDNDVVLRVPGVSKRHALLNASGDTVVLRDQGSKNGVALAGQREEEVSLKLGIEVQFGKCFVELEEISESDTRLGLAFTSGASISGRPAGGRSEMESLDALRCGHPAAATLGFLRPILRRGVFDKGAFRQARKILGATALFTFEVDRGRDATILDCDGPIDPIVWNEARLLGTRSERRLRRRTLENGRLRLWLSGRSPAVPCLAAVFGVENGLRAEGSSTGDWRLEFFAILADLLGESDDQADHHFDTACGRQEALRVPDGMVVGESPPMRRLLDEIGAIRQSRQNSLLLGETGAGKELFAKLLHSSGPTSAGDLVSMNCAAISPNLFEAEFFGVERGAATGVSRREGLLSQADGGTLFLDEIGDMPDVHQVKLLRVLQEHRFRPVGGAERAARFRVIAASNRDLTEEVGKGRFRKDLYYRLCGHQLRIPPLRERPEDIPLLVEEFVSNACVEYGRRIRGVSLKALQLLVDHAWPGNVRELQLRIADAVLHCEPGGTLESKHITLSKAVSRSDAEGRSTAKSAPQASRLPATVPLSGTLQERTDQYQFQHIRETLAAAGGNKSEAARRLGLSRKGLNDKIKRLKIPAP